MPHPFRAIAAAAIAAAVALTLAGCAPAEPTRTTPAPAVEPTPTASGTPDAEPDPWAAPTVAPDSGFDPQQHRQVQLDGWDVYVTSAERDRAAYYVELTQASPPAVEGEFPSETLMTRIVLVRTGNLPSDFLGFEVKYAYVDQSPRLGYDTWPGTYWSPSGIDTRHLVVQPGESTELWYFNNVPTFALDTGLADVNVSVRVSSIESDRQWVQVPIS